MSDADACVLVLNAGSSSLKFALYDVGAGEPAQQARWRGKIGGIGSSSPVWTDNSDAAPVALVLDAERPFRAALEEVRNRIPLHVKDGTLRGVAHRVVHGGSRYFAPTRVDQVVLDELRRLIPLAPLHQPSTLEGIESFFSSHPDVPQIACFDTGFHHGMPMVEQLLPLPYDAWERGLRRYGFHGLSYEYQSIALVRRHGDLARGRTLVAHIGSGASLCAMRNLRSVATTMGFSALDGLMMGTRCGSLDPGIVLSLLETGRFSTARLGQLLYKESGLLGVSGESSDPRLLLAIEDTNPRARIALDLYVHRIVREIGALAAVLGGLDLLVFTAGIGEHNAIIRERICSALGLFNIHLDAAANASHAAVISAADSGSVVAIEPTDEEWVAALRAIELIRN
ncbi:MAG TPA: acetate/propionate family kinase [Dokdonella sp.]|uniref:acetate/propionate family kinase n=1 Tax=Dokdonella sp. TaxID=2291710 RepID=UPI002D80BBE9|nr:acetate/propionate family kinase [Dokdonella sp.]HET9033213.1 acetate/propionate family kinase [Dokdonella sp.]